MVPPALKMYGILYIDIVYNNDNVKFCYSKLSGVYIVFIKNITFQPPFLELFFNCCQMHKDSLSTEIVLKANILFFQLTLFNITLSLSFIRSNAVRFIKYILIVFCVFIFLCMLAWIISITTSFYLFYFCFYFSTDTENIKLVFCAVKDTLMQNALKEFNLN